MAGHGGAWKVAYADFVTAMMAFFMVMWLTSQNKAVKESIAQYFENPLGVAKEARATSVHGIEGASARAPLQGQQAGPHGSDKRDASNSEGEGGGKPPLIRIFENLDRTRTSGTMVLFAEGTTELDGQAKDQIKALVPQLLGKPNKIELRGHASKFPLPKDSPYKDAWQLCYARCLVTKEFMVELGIEDSRIRLSQDGNHEPYSDHKDQVWRAMNSRVEIFSVSEFAYDFKPTAEERAGKFTEYVAPPAAHNDEHHEGHEEEKADGHGGGHAGGHGAAKSDGHGGGHGKEKASGHGAEKAAGHGAKADSHGAAKSDGHGAAKTDGHSAAAKPAKKSGH
ncbi:MAG: flagellar motor protein MotB [Planctomycetaceae bacterium]|nr:flagellar motor protein MotB [Planctomycetaceae bacterium]